MPKSKKQQQARADPLARVSRPARVTVVVRKTGRSMYCSAAEAKALVALRVVDYAQESSTASNTYARRDMMALPAPAPISWADRTITKADDV